jgi:hypothetical protein
MKLSIGNLGWKDLQINCFLFDREFLLGLPKAFLSWVVRDLILVNGQATLMWSIRQVFHKKYTWYFFLFFFKAVGKILKSLEWFRNITTSRHIKSPGGTGCLLHPPLEWDLRWETCFEVSLWPEDENRFYVLRDSSNDTVIEFMYLFCLAEDSNDIPGS